jgi:hypothetical protein
LHTATRRGTNKGGALIKLSVPWKPQSLNAPDSIASTAGGCSAFPFYSTHQQITASKSGGFLEGGVLC